MPPAAPPEFPLHPISSLEEQLALLPEEVGGRPRLRLASELTKLHLVFAGGGEIGRQADLLLAPWEIRLLMVRSGAWLAGRVLPLPTACFRWPDPGERQAVLRLSKEDLTTAPSFDLEKGMSDQEEEILRRHFLSR